LRRMVVNNFPMHGVRAMGRKLPGVVGSSPAELFPINLMAATFHWEGTAERVQQELKRSHRALDRDGHLLNMRYVIRVQQELKREDFIDPFDCCLDFTFSDVLTAEFLLWG